MPLKCALGVELQFYVVHNKPLSVVVVAVVVVIIIVRVCVRV